MLNISRLKLLDEDTVKSVINYKVQM